MPARVALAVKHTSLLGRRSEPQCGGEKLRSRGYFGKEWQRKKQSLFQTGQWPFEVRRGGKPGVFCSLWFWG